MTKKRVISKLLNLQSFIINNHDFSLILIKRDDYKKDYFKITTFTVIFLLWLILWILLDDYQYSLFNNDHNKGWRSKIMPRGWYNCIMKHAWRGRDDKDCSELYLHGRHFDWAAGDRCGMLVLFGKPEISHLFTRDEPLILE